MYMESGIIRNGDKLEIEVIEEKIKIIPRSGGIIVSVRKKNHGNGAGLGFTH